MSKSSRRYLNLRGLKYWFKRDIPAAFRHHFEGKSAYLVNLETSDIREAMRRRDELTSKTNKLFSDAKSGRFNAKEVDEVRELAEVWAREIAEYEDDPRQWTAKVTSTPVAEISNEDVFDPRELVESEAARIKKKHGKEQRDRFLDLAQGRVDVAHHSDAFIKEARLAPKTSAERRNLINKFDGWAKTQRFGLLDINRVIAGRYVSQEIAPLHPSTAKKHLGSVKLYWDYLIRRGIIEGANPWDGQQMPNRGRRVERDRQALERPFTQREIHTLMTSSFPSGMSPEFEQQIRDAMKIAALTGMRVAEIVTLWVEECPLDENGNGYFDIRQGKTSAAARRVPMHPDLVDIVRRRTEGKKPTDWLFHELAKERDAADTFGKRFANYRERLGVDDKRPGQRRSLVNFHSFRRWFVTQAEQAGIPESTISSVVGHETGRKSITLSVYSGGPAWEQMRACVEAVRLP